MWFKVNEHKVQELGRLLLCQRLSILKIADKFPHLLSMTYDELTQRLACIKVSSRPKGIPATLSVNLETLYMQGSDANDGNYVSEALCLDGSGVLARL